jgi:predicted transcriptional regulator
VILGRILDYLATHRVASLVEIATALDSTPDAVRGMLETLQRRGLVHAVRASADCGTRCRQCAAPDVEVYAYGREVSQGLAAGPCGSRLR